MVTPFGSSQRDAPLDPEYREALLAVVNRTMIDRWGPQRGHVKTGLRSLFEVLLAHGDFAEGGRIALSVDALAELLWRRQRSLSTLIGELEALPELIIVVRVPPGGIACTGHPSPVGHLECELGPSLRALGGKSPAGLQLPPRKGRPGKGEKPYATHSGKTLVRMPPEYLDSLRKVAAANNTSLGGAIVVLLDQHQQFRELLTQPLAR